METTATIWFGAINPQAQPAPDCAFDQRRAW